MNLDEIIEVFPVPVFYKDVNGVFVACNQAFVEFKGLSRQEILGKTGFDIALAPLASEYQAADRELLCRKPGAHISHETNSCRADGRERRVIIHKRTLSDGSGVVTGVLGIIFDVTELRRSERTLTTLFRACPDMIALTDRQTGRHLKVNDACERVVGFSSREMIGRTSLELGIWPSPEERARVFAELQGSERLLNFESTLRHKNGKPFPILISMEGVEVDGRDCVLVIVRDITELKRKDERIHHLAFHDLVTGLPNRSLLVDRLDHALAVARRERRNLAVLFLDLDHFKFVNDTLGHYIGDELLKTVASRIKATVRGTDTVSRLGGDEFVILLDNPAEETEVAQIAQRIIAAINQPLEFLGKPAQVGASIGIAIYPIDGHTSTKLMKNADTAMYAAKATGRNSFRFFNARMAEQAEERLKLQFELREAVRCGNFELFYQPQLCLTCMRPSGAEALIRWRHPGRGQVPPASFIPLAEESGLIVDIGDWVLHSTCQALANWRRGGLANLKVAVNVSAVQLREGAIVGQLAQLLGRHGIDGRQIELELTESAVMADPEQAVAVLRKLRTLGATIAVDDFGTGYSSLSYLTKLPLDTIKIDRSFIAGSARNGENAEIVRAILALGKALRHMVVAEGVETAEQAAFLRAEGCSMAQGYYFAPPLPEKEFEAWLHARGGLCDCQGENAAALGIPSIGA